VAWEYFQRYGIRVFGVKLGAQGCFIADIREAFFLPTLVKGDIVDTTGAGDAFFSGFLARWLDGCDLRQCALFGSASAACCIGAVGATAGIKGLDDTQLLMQTRAKELGL